MNILLIIDYSSHFQGGFIHSLRILSEKLTNDNHTVCYIFSKANDYLEKFEIFGKVFIIESFCEKKFDFLLIKKAYKIIKENNIDIIHSNFGLASFITATILSGYFKIQHISHERAITQKNNKKMIYLLKKVRARLFFKILDLLGRNYYIAVSKGVKKDLIEYNGYSTNSIKIIPNGVTIDKSNFFAIEMNKEIEIVKNWSKNGFLQIAMTSQLEPRKDHFTIINAANYLVNEKGKKKIRFIFIGDARNEKSKPYKKALVKRIKSLKLEDYFFLTGIVPNPHLIIKHIDIGLLISKFEGFGNAVVEYMLAGKPVIGTRVGGIPDIIDEGGNGYLIDQGNYVQLANYIYKLSVDQNLRKNLGFKAKFKAVTEYSNETWADNIVHLYTNQLKVN